MRIREYTSADFDALRRLHAAQGFGYALPNLDSPLFVTKLVLEEDGEASSNSTGFLTGGTMGSLWGSSNTSKHCSRCEESDAADSFDPREEIRSRESRAGSESGREASRKASREVGRESPRETPDRDRAHSLRCADSLSHAADAGGSSRIVMAVLLRLTAETYFLHDPDAGTPRDRWQRLLALHEAARQAAAARGLDDVQAFVPPQIARAFGRRLTQLGWSRDPWPCFSRRVP